MLFISNQQLEKAFLKKGLWKFPQLAVKPAQLSNHQVKSAPLAQGQSNTDHAPPDGFHNELEQIYLLLTL
ncbi:MAG TPA: hypothetical protein DCQ59_11765 [Verrucomicrobiales bacterium]|nr:hypothetical protein [Verrucomicrobiales bacterium]